MASSFYNNSQHIDFDSVLAMDDQVIYEAALVDFFENASVREGVIISRVAGQLVEISEEWFTESFDLPVDGLGDLSEIPKDVIFDARSIVSLSGEPAGSFNAITVEKFSMVTTVVCGVRMKWACILFNIFKKMVTPGSKQAKGFAVQRKLLRHSSQRLPRRIIVAVAQEAVPIQMVEPITVAPAAEDLSDQPAGKTDGEEAVAAEVDASADRDQPTGTTDERQCFDLSHEELIAKWDAERQVTTPDDIDEEIEAERPVFGTVAGNAPLQSVDITAVTEPVVEQHFESVAAVEPAVEVGEVAVDKDFSLVDYPDTVINQVLNQLDSISDDKDDKQSDREETMDVGPVGGDQQMSLEDILMTIPADFPLPSAGIEITKITMGKTIKIPGVDDRTLHLANLPKIPADNKGNKILVQKDPVKGNPAKEHYFLICVDIDLLVNLRAQVIEAVDQFFHSFSFKKLATINIEELSRKEEHVLIWEETEITHVALSRKSTKKPEYTDHKPNTKWDNPSNQGIQLAVSPQPLWLRNHNFGLAQRIMVKRLATSPHDPLGITDSACKNQLVVVSVQYGPFNTHIPIRSTTIGKSRVAKDPIAMYTSWRSNSDIASVTRVSMMFRVVRTNQYNQDLRLIHSTNGNHLESPNEGSSIDHQVTIYLHAQNITMFPTNETWYFASQILVSSSGGLILILTAQSTRN
ncbi:hypothetical protein F511_31642 [Dorcoceras hygrometricum]|uniref:Uncharacterized protein n=1 Tax=Dorcoceras hygrometricum TaxID=472368 RepID=A0A2Z7A3W8_9LAMI|nr:hypothetical protein F511_31642 [Dorcoceras hygrometricum]